MLVTGGVQGKPLEGRKSSGWAGDYYRFHFREKDKSK